MAFNYYTKAYWSIVFDPEDTTSTGAGQIDFNNGKGSLTGVKTLSDYIIMPQERLYTVFGYIPQDNPLSYIREVNYGMAFQDCITKVIKGGLDYLLYVSPNGDWRITNGPSYDDSIARPIQPLAQTFINNRTVDSYYTGVDANAVPNSMFDRRNNLARLFFAGDDTYNQSSVSYSLTDGRFSTGTDNVNACVVDASTSTNVGVLGNSDSTGTTKQLYYNFSDYNKTGVLDLGWQTAKDGNNNRIRVKNIWVKIYPETGVTSASNASFTMTAECYRDFSSTITKSEPRTIAYNASTPLQTLFFNLMVSGEYVRVVLRDSGSYKNYAIEEIKVEIEEFADTNKPI